MSIQDEIDPEDSPFIKCDNCGSIYQKSNGHHCPETKETGDYIPADEVRERIRVVEKTDMYQPNRTVLAVTDIRKPRAYHLPKGPMHRVPDCATATAHEWVAMSQEEAHERGRYPCGHCWPDIVAEEDTDE